MHIQDRNRLTHHQRQIQLDGFLNLLLLAPGDIVKIGTQEIRFDQEKVKEEGADSGVRFESGSSAKFESAKAAEVGLDCQPANDIGAALEDLLATQPAPMRILVCGSLYLAGEILARNG